MKGLIFNINRYAVHDGPGIRLTFFLKGCPLGCWWCHNPEGISPLPEVVERIDRIGEREYKRKENVGKYYSVDELVDIVERDIIFIEESGGGVTFSGGEPMMQFDFLNEALSAFSKMGIGSVVDTAGYAARTKYESIIGKTELFLFDIKHLDPEKHMAYTGVSNGEILDNFRYLVEKGSAVIARVPVIPGFNDSDDHMEKLHHFFSQFKGSSLVGIDLLPYHRIGMAKYKKFSMEYRMGGVEQPSGDRMKELADYFTSTGLKIKVGG